MKIRTGLVFVWLVAKISKIKLAMRTWCQLTTQQWKTSQNRTGKEKGCARLTDELPRHTQKTSGFVKGQAIESKFRLEI
jgi:hypothetical protein